MYNKNIVNKDTPNIYDYFVIKISDTVKNFIEEYLSKGNIDNKILGCFIFMLINDNPEKIPEIFKGVIKGYVLNGVDIYNIVFTLIEKYPEKILRLKMIQKWIQ